LFDKWKTTIKKAVRQRAAFFFYIYENRLMKKVLSFLVFFWIVAASAQTQMAVPTADEILQPAYAKAAAENKNVLVIFHASWCGWCRKMDTALQDAAVKPLMDKSYEVVHLTVYESPNNKHLENKGALSFLTKHGGAEQGLPYWYILNKEGKVLSDSKDEAGQNTGCPATEAEVAYFTREIKKTSSLSDNEVAVIKKRFRQNE
jgi:thioredoxin-related protein